MFNVLSSAVEARSLGLLQGRVVSVGVKDGRVSVFRSAAVLALSGLWP